MARPRTPSHVVIAYDATKHRSLHELRLTVNGVRRGGDILTVGDTIVFVAVLDKVLHPMGYQAKPCLDSLGTSIRALKEAVSEKVDAYVNMLLRSAQQCENQRVSIQVKVIAGFPVKQVILQELMACNAAWVVLDRHLKRYLKFYLMHIPCKIAVIEDSLAVEVVRAYQIEDTDTVEHKRFYSMSKLVPVFDCQRCSAYIASLESANMIETNSRKTGTPKDKRPKPEKKDTGGTSSRAKRDRFVKKEESQKRRGGKIHLRVAHWFSCIARRHEGA